MRFAADAMLGRLGRWLRVLGYDTFYDAAIADPARVRLAAEEGRMLLTRDRHLLRELRPVQALEVRRDDPLEQLQDLVAALALQGPVAMFSRCLVCNTPLEDLDAAEAAVLAQELEYAPPSPVRRCPCCHKLFWEGSHSRRMRAALRRALPDWDVDGAVAARPQPTREQRPRPRPNASPASPSRSADAGCTRCWPR
jgi:uncharacterized protein with PIN domain